MTAIIVYVCMSFLGGILVAIGHDSGYRRGYNACAKVAAEHEIKAIREVIAQVNAHLSRVSMQGDPQVLQTKIIEPQVH